MNKLKHLHDEGVTVVIPFYNRSSFAERVLQSISLQTYLPSDVLFVDNGSTSDEIASLKEIITKYDAKFLNVRYIDTKKIGNANIARNYGMEMAATRYVAFLDSDDWWDPKHLEKSLDVLKRTDKPAVYSGSTIHSSSEYINKSADIANVPTAFHILFSRRGWIAQSSTYVVDKHRLGAVKWDERLKRHQDYDFFLSIAFEDEGWAFNPFATGYLDRVEVKKGRNFDFKSMIRFLHKWISFFPKECLEIYLLNQLDLCLISNSSNKYYNYYRSKYIMESKYNFISKIKSCKRYRSIRMMSIELTRRLKVYNLMKAARV